MIATVADMIQDWLDREQRPQAFLARKAGISISTMSSVLLGYHQPSAAVLRRLEKAMGLPPGTLEGVQAQQQLEMNNGAGGQR